MSFNKATAPTTPTEADENLGLDVFNLLNAHPKNTIGSVEGLKQLIADSRVKPTAEAKLKDERFDKIKPYAKTLLKALCGYGGGSRCDCKFITSSAQKFGEQTGCCEARAILDLCEATDATK